MEKMTMTKRPLLRLLAVVLLAGTWQFGVIPTANAQAQVPGTGQAPRLPDISDQKLDATVAALERITSIREDYDAQISRAEPSEKERIVKDANSALEKAVTDQGLSVEEFNTIIVVARNN